MPYRGRALRLVRRRPEVLERGGGSPPPTRGVAEPFSVETRGPHNLIALPRPLIAASAFTPLHLLHIVYAVFLDRSLVAAVDRETRSAVLAYVAASASSDDRVSALYVSLHLSALEEPEATVELRSMFESAVPRWLFKRLVAGVVAPDIRGVAAWGPLGQGGGRVAPEVGP